jgi:hypothetical protein
MGRKILGLFILFTFMITLGTAFAQYRYSGAVALGPNGQEYRFSPQPSHQVPRGNPRSAPAHGSAWRSTSTSTFTSSPGIGSGVSYTAGAPAGKPQAQKDYEYWKPRADAKESEYNYRLQKKQDTLGTQEPRYTRGYYGQLNPNGYGPRTSSLETKINDGGYEASRLITYDDNGNKWEFRYRDDNIFYLEGQNEWTVYKNGTQVKNHVGSFEEFVKHHGDNLAGQRWWYIDHRQRRSGFLWWGGKDKNLGSHPYVFLGRLSDAIERCKAVDGSLGT